MKFSKVFVFSGNEEPDAVPIGTQLYIWFKKDGKVWLFAGGLIEALQPTWLPWQKGTSIAESLTGVPRG